MGAGTDSAAQVPGLQGTVLHRSQSSSLTGLLQLQRRYAELGEEMMGEEEGIREEKESSLAHVHIIYLDFTVIEADRETFTELAELLSLAT